MSTRSVESVICFAMLGMDFQSDISAMRNLTLEAADEPRDLEMSDEARSMDSCVLPMMTEVRVNLIVCNQLGRRDVQTRAMVQVQFLVLKMVQTHKFWQYYAPVTCEHMRSRFLSSHLWWRQPYYSDQGQHRERIDVLSEPESDYFVLVYINSDA